MICYIILSYLIMAGIVLGEMYNNIRFNVWQFCTWFFSPILLPVYLGFILSANISDNVKPKK